VGQEHVVTVNDPFAVAEALAPVPATRGQATTDAWVRHYAALAMAAWTAFHRAVSSTDTVTPPWPDLGLLAGLAVAATAAAHGLALPSQPEDLWDLTPECGALNGEWEEWLAKTLDAHGINPADIDPRYSVGDFRSPTRAGAR
jgi:hypothetical protein